MTGNQSKEDYFNIVAQIIKSILSNLFYPQSPYINHREHKSNIRTISMNVIENVA